jgi:hypothetical protein
MEFHGDPWRLFLYEPPVLNRTFSMALHGLHGEELNQDVP